jgi:hypothetical protein
MIAGASLWITRARSKTLASAFGASAGIGIGLVCIVLHALLLGPKASMIW